MDRALKERLIGAVVLVGIGVWLIPWVLDGPPARDDQAAPLELPVPDEPVPLRTQTIHLDQRDAPAAVDSRAVPAPASGQASGEVAAATGELDEARAAQPAGAAPAEEPAGASGSRPQEPAPQQEAPATEPASLAETPAGETRVPAEPASEPEPTPPPEETRTAAATPAGGDWLVQIGSFGQEENARRLAERVSALGETASITNVRTGGRLMHRVRVGPYETRRQAEEAAAALSAQGFVAQVVSAD